MNLSMPQKAFPLVVVVLAACAPSDGLRQMLADDMRLVRGSTFRMGTDRSEVSRIVALTGLRDDGPLQPEMPGHSTTVKNFFLDTVDVTNGAFAEFVATNPDWGRDRADSSLHNGRYLEHWSADGPSAQLDLHPVTFVSWDAAVAYCEWRGKRLPTEAEYEWAAQDGRTRAEYPWGDTPPTDDLVNWGGSGVGTTVPVGSYPPNARGLYDMAGNVWRFTADPWLGPYATMLADSSGVGETDADEARRVVRGGSYGANAANLRVRYRDSHRSFDAREMVGFRCAMSAGA